MTSTVRVSPDGRELAALVDGTSSGREGSDAGRRLLGLAGAPGVGKSTMASVVAALSGAAVLPMDGYHLADVELVRRGLRDRKGAPETFDTAGYVSLLRRLRAGEADVVAPMFERGLEQPLAGAVALPATGPVVTEGNYLLLDRPPWAAVRGLLDEVWHLRVDAAVRRDRLVARHVRFGKSPEDARAWVEAVDEPNAVLVEAAAARADVVLDLTDWEGR